MTLTQTQKWKLGPEWQPRIGLLQVDMFQRAYQGHAGSIDLDDLREIAKGIAGYQSPAEEDPPNRFMFATGQGSYAIDVPKIVFGNSGPFLDGTTEVKVLGKVTDNEIECAAIFLRNGMDGRHLKRSKPPVSHQQVPAAAFVTGNQLI
jgi:hypothetical protein